MAAPLMRITINSTLVAVPEGAVAYKYADPTEDARWLYDQDETREIEHEDAGLLVYVEAVETNRKAS